MDENVPSLCNNESDFYPNFEVVKKLGQGNDSSQFLNFLKEKLLISKFQVLSVLSF